MIYADYAATTPLDPGVLEEMMPYFGAAFYNPSSLYPEAAEVKKGVELARSRVRQRIGASCGRLIFTSGGTESDNLAVLGTALHPDQRRRHVITSAAEHHALLESCAFLERMGFQVTYLPVNRWGQVEPETLEQAMTKDTFLVSLMWVNNETGAVQDIPRLAEIAHRGGALFHSDGVQAMATQEIRVEEAGVDLLSISSHKIYGPKGTGALYVSDQVPLSPVQHGGGQEGGLRGGTEHVAGIVGFGAAASRLEETGPALRRSLKRWKKRLTEAFGQLKGTVINSPLEVTSDSIFHVSFSGVEAEGLLFLLARQGIQLSMGSACNASSVEPSHVVRAIGVPEAYARGSIRISLGCGMTDEDLEELIRQVKICVQRLRAW